MDQTVTFNADDLTGDQAIFLNEKTGLTIPELMTAIETENFTPQTVIAMAALALNPEDPATAYDELRKEKITAIAERATAALKTD